MHCCFKIEVDNVYNVHYRNSVGHCAVVACSDVLKSIKLTLTLTREVMEGMSRNIAVNFIQTSEIIHNGIELFISITLCSLFSVQFPCN